MNADEVTCAVPSPPVKVLNLTVCPLCVCGWYCPDNGRTGHWLCRVHGAKETDHHDGDHLRCVSHGQCLVHDACGAGGAVIWGETDLNAGVFVLSLSLQGSASSCLLCWEFLGPACAVPACCCTTLCPSSWGCACLLQPAWLSLQWSGA